MKQGIRKFTLPITAPHLDGAACASERELFDSTIDGRNPTAEEHALTICQSCAAQTACKDWFVKLPAGKRPRGVTAGFVYRPRTRKNPYDD